MASGAVGAVISTFALAGLDSRLQHHGVILITVIGLMGATVSLFAYMPDLPTACLVLFFNGAVQMIFYTVSNTMLQTIVPDRLRGRVNSIFMTQWGIGPAGTLLAGVAIEAIGPRSTIAIMGAAVVLLAFMLFWLAPQLWQYDGERRAGG
jgi:MFS family permease